MEVWGWGLVGQKVFRLKVPAVGPTRRLVLEAWGLQSSSLGACQVYQLKNPAVGLTRRLVLEAWGLQASKLGGLGLWVTPGG